MLLKKSAKLWIFLPFLLSSCLVLKEIVFNTAGINDHKIFHSRILHPSPQPFQFTDVGGTLLDSAGITVQKDKRHLRLEEILEPSGTVAFLVIRNDSMLCEKYFHRYEAGSIVNSFSMAKSFISALIGMAVEDGKISSVEDSMTKYLPELQRRGLGSISIRNLLQMTTGIQSGEGYLNPFAMVSKLYYGRNQKNVVKHLTLEQRPGATFQYRSVNTLLLGMIVERVMEKPITTLLQERIWTPLGMEHEANWSLDRKDGLEKPFCCLNAVARDFAKFGRLYLKKGSWNGNRILSEEWVRKSTTVDARDGAAWYYQYQWWLDGREGNFYASGYLGQFIYVNPSKNLIIVRLGKRDGDIYWPAALREIANQL